MRQLTILSGAGINLAISATCPEADQMLDFTYQKISKSVHGRISQSLQRMFSPESFDYILGGLLTVNLAIEKTKRELKRFNVDEQSFSEIFIQSDLERSIMSALDSIEQQLTISLDQMLEVTRKFSPSINDIFKKYGSINYFTVNFDSIFDHILYGPGYVRRNEVTDFWRKNGSIDEGVDRKVKIQHLHGDLRFKPFKKTRYNNPPYRWPVVVVGDQEVKRGIIASHDFLRFYEKKFKEVCRSKGVSKENNLAIVGFGFRDEDSHIVTELKSAIEGKVFDNVFLFDTEDRLAGISDTHQWVSPKDSNLMDFFSRL